MKHRSLWFWMALLAGFGITLAGGFLLTRSQNQQAAARLALQPGIAYLSPVSGSEIWLQEMDGSQPRQISNTGGRVKGLEALPDGGRLIAVIANSQGGRDLALLNWDGSDMRILVGCGAENCSAPKASPDGRWVAYTRAAADSLDSPAAWLFEMADGETYPLENDILIRALDFSWSPDSSRLAFYDPASGGVRVREMGSGVERVLETNVPQAGSWSADSRFLTINHEEIGPVLASMKVYIYDMLSDKPRLLLGSSEDDASDYSVPCWSPDGQWLAFGQIRLPGSPAKQIWLIRPDGSDAMAVTDDLTYAHAGYLWSPDSENLVFQRLALGASDNTPELMIWEMRSGNTQLLAKDAYNPVWLP